MSRTMASRLGKDSHDVGATADLAVESLGGVVGPDLPPHVVGEHGEREEVFACIAEVLGHVGESLVLLLQ